MSERKHSVLIGAFIVGSLLILLATALFFGGSGFGGTREKVVMVFDGSVKGLSVGAPVALRGVQVGQVTDIQLILSMDKADITMLVEADLVAENVQLVGGSIGAPNLTKYLIENGLRAQLNMQSVLTGLLYVQMDFHPETPLNLADISSPYTQIPTIPTELELLRRTLQSLDYAQLTRDIGDISRSMNAFVSAENFQQLPTDLRAALASLRDAGDSLHRNLDGVAPRVDAMLLSAGSAADRVNTELPRLMTAAEKTFASADAAMLSMRDAMQSLDDQVGEQSPTVYQLNTALDELAQASRALRSLAQMLEEEPDALLRGRRESTP